MSSILALPLPRQPLPPLRVSTLACVLSRMTPGLTALILPGESWDEMMARREAADEAAEAVTW